MRNPLDVYPSIASFVNTMSHGNKTDFEPSEKYPEWWSWWIKTQTAKMKRFFATIRKDFVDLKKNPLYMVRYEDLVLKPQETILGMLSFLLG